MEYNNGPSQGSVLTFGILSLALCGSAILGLIFGIICKSKAKAYIAAHGQLEGSAKPGNILGTIGLIISIIMIVIYIILIIVGATQ